MTDPDSQTTPEAAERIPRVGEGPRTEAAREAIARLRLNLLDLTNRNNLVSMKHSDRARTHVRVIDELPDQLLNKLEGEKTLAFQSLPEPTDEPDDEKSDEFRFALAAAREHDETYRTEIDRIGDDPGSRRARKLERDLKDRVRAQLGWSPRASTETMSIAEYARAHNHDPSYDLPTPAGDRIPGHHADNEIQTLLLPEQMERKLSGLAQTARSALQEMGANTLYAVFGFLEWYESQSSDRPIVAPLLLHPVSISRRLVNARYRYEIVTTGEETATNITLSERLARDFGLRLPDYADTDTPESYFEKVQHEIVRHHARWKVRRFVTVGHFSFARLVMYRDLDPENWPEGREMHTHAGLSALLGGTNEDVGTSAEPYAVDDPAIAAKVPLLIADADSSQFSAVVDAMDGKNLAIEGPPGTGKSQTITNIIGSALAQGKRVLFVAEKMAALEVVKARLDQAGLGEFALELHSTKARKADVLESLKARLDIQSRARPPAELDDARQRLHDLKHQLTRYVDLLNSPLGRINMTIQQVLWAEQNTRDRTHLPEALSAVRLPEAEHATPYVRDEAKGHLKIIERHARAFTERYGAPEHHPWHGVTRSDIDPFQQDEILARTADWRAALERLSNDLAAAPGGSTTLQDARRLGHARLPEDCGAPALFAQLADRDLLAEAEQLVGALAAWQAAHRRQGARSPDPEALNRSAEALDALVHQAQSLTNSATRLSDLPAQAARLRQDAQTWGELVALARELIGLVPDGPELTADDVRPLLRACRTAWQTPRQTLVMRSADLVDPTAAEVLAHGRQRAQELRAERDAITRTMNMPGSSDDSIADLRRHAAALHRGGALAALSRDVRAAKAYFKARATGRKTPARHEIARTLERAAELLRDIKAFDTDSELARVAGARWRSIDTDFDALAPVQAFAEGVRQDLAGREAGAKAARQLLLHANMEALDEVIALAQDRRFEPLSRALDELSSTDTGDLDEITAQMEARARAIDQVKAQADELNLNGELTLADLADVRADAVTAGEAQARISGLPRSVRAAESADLADRIAPEADPRPLDAAVEAARGLHDADLPEGVRAHLFAADYPVRRQALLEITARIAAALEETDRAADAAIETCALDVDRFFGPAPEQDELAWMIGRLTRAEGDPSALATWGTYLGARARAAEAGLQEILDAYDGHGHPYIDLELAYDRVLFRTLAHTAYRTNPELAQFDGVTQEEARTRFRSLDRELIEFERQALRSQLAHAPIPRGNSEGRVRDRTELGLINQMLSVAKPRTPMRELFDRSLNAIQDMKPCFMMSPLSVAQYLKPGRCEFDLVVMDEASQMKPEDAVGALVRAGQIVVVGDPKQLPPTSFFDRVAGSADDEDDEDAAEATQIKSILESAMSCWQPYRRLLWHYRSRHGSLIAFSNEKFYDGDLIVFPSPIKDHPDYGVKLEPVDGFCRPRTGMNEREARAVATAAVAFMKQEAAKPDAEMRSLGVVAMNRAQTDLIYQEVSQLVSHDLDAYRYTEAMEARGAGIESFFIKNLENVQGDERDVIFISVTYGPDPDSRKVLNRFGPINGAAGHRRLNVLFTRAKEQVRVFSSMRAQDINIKDPATPAGRRALHDYLEYAATGRLFGGDGHGRAPENDFEYCVKDRLEALGYEVTCQVGVAGYFIDLAVSHPAFPNGYLAGIECDGATYHSARSARDRDRLRQDVLEHLGWDICRIWSTDWFADPDGETRKLGRHLQELLRRKATRSSAEADRADNDGPERAEEAEGTAGRPEPESETGAEDEGNRAVVDLAARKRSRPA